MRIEIKKFALVIKREMNAWREGMSYVELETFVGCTLAQLKVAELITAEEEAWLRDYLVR